MPKKISDLIAKLRSEMPELEDNAILDEIEVAAYDTAEGDEGEAEGEPEPDESLSDEQDEASGETPEGAALDVEALDSEEDGEEFSPEDFPMPKLNKKPKRQMA
jgi:hypothetical protein